MISFEICGSRQHLVFSSEALTRFSSWRQLQASDKEAGGQLFARDEGNIIRVVEASGPRPADRRSRYSFRPDRNSERIEIVDMHSKGLHFVGDWHTHPEDIPSPSWRDIQSLTVMFKRSTHCLNGMLMVIVGRREPPDGLFVGFGNQHGLVKLELVSSRPMKSVS